MRRLLDELDAARQADIPDLAEVRECKERFVAYFAWCVLQEMKGGPVEAPSGPRFEVIHNDGPVQRSPRRMSSPIKSDDIRAFESLVGRVFGVEVSATTGWSGG